MQNGQSGVNIKKAKNMRKTAVKIYYSSFIQETALPKK